MATHPHPNQNKKSYYEEWRKARHILAKHPALFLLLREYADCQGRAPFSFYSQNTIAKRLGLSRRTIVKNTQKLVGLGYLKINGRNPKRVLRIGVKSELCFTGDVKSASHNMGRKLHITNPIYQTHLSSTDDEKSKKGKAGKEGTATGKGEPQEKESDKEDLGVAETITKWAYERANKPPGILRPVFRKTVLKAIGRVGKDTVWKIFKDETNAITFLYSLKHL